MSRVEFGPLNPERDIASDAPHYRSPGKKLERRCPVQEQLPIDRRLKTRPRSQSLPGREEHLSRAHGKGRTLTMHVLRSRPDFLEMKLQ